MSEQTVYYQVLVPAITGAREAHVPYLAKIRSLAQETGVILTDSGFSDDDFIEAQDDSPARWSGYLEVLFAEGNNEAIKIIENALIDEGAVVTSVEED
jgi:hypothetical protein